ncbi:MAG: MotA/TolQ/ExbB proton channel family protein [Algisphaera sp.]
MSRLAPLLAMSLVALVRVSAAAQSGLPVTPEAAVSPPAATQSTSFFRAFFLADDFLGLLIIWLLIVASVVSLSLIGLFLMRYRRGTVLPNATQQGIEGLINQRKYREAITYANSQPSYLGRITGAALNEANHGYAAMERALEEAADAEATRMLRPIEILNVLGNIAPMVGLFGTVYGMIVAFQSLVDAGGSPDPVELAGGISTALVTTFWGLIVAIPALAAYALVRNKVDALTAEALLVSESIIKPFKPVPRKPKPAGGEA